MRGARLRPAPLAPLPGIIPAYAGSTRPTAGATSRATDHPRVCGEHRYTVNQFDKKGGSSPRMRGAHAYRSPSFICVGIIPAYAGSTIRERGPQWPLRDHPRVCGEHFVDALSLPSDVGSSPRMRGALFVADVMADGHGIIPAYAGSTEGHRQGPDLLRDHPRVCGEHGRCPRYRRA